MPPMMKDEPPSQKKQSRVSSGPRNSKFGNTTCHQKSQEKQSGVSSGPRNSKFVKTTHPIPEK